MVFGHDALEAAIRDKPPKRDEDVNRRRHPREEEGSANARGVENGRQLSLEVVPEGSKQRGARIDLSENEILQNVISDRGEEKDRAVNSGGQGGEMVFAGPTSDERKERKPEEKMQIGPHDRTVNPRREAQEMVVIIPLNAEVDEAQDIAEENGQQRSQRGEAGAVRHL